MLKLVTFLPMEQIAEYEKLEGQDLNRVKCILAYEVTKMVHGEAAAKEANDAATAIFSGGGDTSNMPSETIVSSVMNGGMNILDLLVQVKLIPSKGEGRRLIQQNGLSLDGEKVTSVDLTVTPDMFRNGEIVVKKGKKTFLKLILK